MKETYVKEEMKKPYTAMGNPGVRSDNGGNDSSARLERIAVKARTDSKERFNNLFHHLTPELIARCLSNIPLRSSAGVDKMTVKEVRENLNWLLPPVLEQIREGRYSPPPVKRVYIPKTGGKLRPIGVPSVLDRTIQAAMAKIMGMIYEQDFLNCSYGFRPGIGCHHALASLAKVLSGRDMNFVLEVDIRDFFGSLNHEWLRKFLGLRIGDPRILKLIDAWLAAGVIENDKWRSVEIGSPQGGSISPVLSNVYLHYVLDLWFQRKVQRKLKGKSHLIRYADDFLIVFQNREDAEITSKLLTARLGQFGLQVAEEKTHISDLTPRVKRGADDRRHISFLGFNIFRTQNRKKTGWKVTYQTESKRFTRSKLRMKEQLKKNMHDPIEKQAKSVNWLLAGHFNYFGLPGNTDRIKSFHYETLAYWRRVLSKRSQKAFVNWDVFNKSILVKHPVAQPTLRIKYEELNGYVRL